MAQESIESRDRDDGALERIRAALRGLRFGSVTAVVQDGIVVQVERTERVRLGHDGERARRGPTWGRGSG